MIAVDTNLLVYSHRQESTWHEKARKCIQSLAEGRGSWAIPWPCIHEFFSIVTHPRIFNPPSPVDKALSQIDAWFESPALVLLGETGNHLGQLRKQVEIGSVVGPKVHDARIAAICLDHGVEELWTADRDFERFPDLKKRNPLAE